MTANPGPHTTKPCTQGSRGGRFNFNDNFSCDTPPFQPPPTHTHTHTRAEAGECVRGTTVLIVESVFDLSCEKCEAYANTFPLC